MSSIVLAFKAFVRTLTDREFRRQVDQLLRGVLPEAVPAQKPQPTEPATIVDRKRPARSEALTLLAALQREARLVDFIREPIASYSDAQIGAAVRDIHRDCAVVLDRIFGIQPLLTDEEGAQVDIPAGFDATRYSLTGAVSGQPPYRGVLAHHGWQATRCVVPQWSGSNEAANVVAPAVVELK